RLTPARRSGGSDRAGRSAPRAPNPPPHGTGQRRGPGGIKSLQSRPQWRCAPRARGVDANQTTRAFVLLVIRREHSEDPAQSSGILPSIEPSRGLLPGLTAPGQTALPLRGCAKENYERGEVERKKTGGTDSGVRSKTAGHPQNHAVPVHRSHQDLQSEGRGPAVAAPWRVRVCADVHPFVLDL